MEKARFIDTDTAFEAAFEAQEFSRRDAESGLYMYMGTWPAPGGGERHHFKHTITREYTWVEALPQDD